MYKIFSEKIVRKLIENEIIKKEEAKMYEYCFVLLISTLASIFSIGIIAILTNTLVSSSVILLSFLICRMCCGGYHASNHLSCYILTILNHIVCLVLLSYFSETRIPSFIGYLNIFSFVLLFLFSPVENKNNPLSAKEIIFHKFQCRIIAIVTIISSFIPIYYPKTQLVFASLSIGVFSATFSMLLSFIKDGLNTNFKGGVYNE